MKKLLRVQFPVTIGLIALLVISGVALAAYAATIQVNENSGTSYDMIGLRVPFLSDYYATNGYFATATGLDTRVMSGTDELPHLLGDDKLLFALPLTGGSSLPLDFTTGNAALTDFNIVLGNGGYYDVSDHVTMELGSDWSMAWTDWYTGGGTGSLVEKPSAMGVSYNATSGNVTASVRQGQPIVGGVTDGINGGATTEYNAVMGGLLWAAAEATNLQVVPTAGVFRDLRIELSAALAGGSTAIFTLMKNGVAQSLSVALTAGQSSGSDTDVDVTYAAGDTISLRCVTTGASGAPYARWASTFIPSTYGETIFMSTGVTSNGGTVYFATQGGGTNTFTENQVMAPIPTGGTMSDMYVVLSAAPGAGSYDFTLRDAGADSTLTVNIANPATTGNDVANSVAFTAGDLINIEITPNGGPAVSPSFTVGMVFTPITPGEYPIMGVGGYSGSRPSTVATNYQTLITSSSAWTATESNVYQLTQQTIYKNLYVSLSVAPGGAASYRFDLRVEGADSGLSVNITGAATSGSDVLRSYTTADGDTVDMESTPAGPPAATYVNWGVVAYRPDPTLTAVVSAGEHDLIAAQNDPFVSLGVDVSGDITPVTAGLVLNAPLWQTEEYAASGGTFQTVDPNGFTATVTGATWAINEGYFFDSTGSEHITLSALAADFGNDNTYTVNVWALFGTTVAAAAFMEGNTVSNNSLLGIYADSATSVNFAHRDDAGTGAFLNGTVASGSWNMLTGVRRAANSFEFYINGISVDTDITNVGVTTIDTFEIGEWLRAAGATWFMDGYVGEVQLWDTDMTTDEVVQIYFSERFKYLGAGSIQTVSTLSSVPDNANDYVFNESAAVSYAASVDVTVGGVQAAYWNPNDIISGTTLPDRSVNSNDGTINWGNNPVGITVTIGSLYSTSTTTATTTPLAPPDAMPLINLPFTFPGSSTVTSTNPLSVLVTAVTESTNTPAQMVWYFGAMIFVMLAIGITHKHLPNVWISGVAGLFAIGAAIGMAILPMWLMYVAAIAVVGAAVLDRSPQY